MEDIVFNVLLREIARNSNSSRR